MTFKKKIIIIGGGVSALMLGAELDSDKFDIHIYEKGNKIGDKFLVAGKGGFNLTHSEKPEDFIKKYVPSSFIKKYFNKFNNIDLRKWLEGLGVPTIIGSSKKVYPTKGTKPIKVLNSILKRVKDNKVNFHFGFEWINFSEEFNPVFNSENSLIEITSDIVIFALGGSSWKVTGSDGKWIDIFKEQNIQTLPFEPSNCAFKVDWTEQLLDKIEGKPIKNISTSIDNKKIVGELLITKFGFEGGAVYALSSELRNQLKNNNIAFFKLDLKPNLSISEIELRYSNKKNGVSITKFLKEDIKLDKIKISLLKYFTTKTEFNNISILSRSIKSLKIPVVGLADIDEAISTVGGISLDAVDENLKIKQLPFHYAVGEMLDWDAPTGGYLLQASFSMGYFLAHYLNNKSTIKNKFNIN